MTDFSRIFMMGITGYFETAICGSFNKNTHEAHYGSWGGYL